MSWRWVTLGALIALVTTPVLWKVSVGLANPFRHWSEARWDSAGLAPDPAATPEAVVQVYAARAWGWKGIFAVHTWLVMKREGAPRYERYEVVGWGVRGGSPAVRKDMRAVDGYWAGNPPRVVIDRRGPEAGALIDRIEAAIATYPYPNEYRAWPGPNSNTFIAHIARSVPELGLELPPTAIGKDYLANGSVFAATPSGTGYQMSLLGLFGLAIGRDEGLELNLFGMTLGIDPLDLAIKLPAVGRIGLL
ncbi:MAG TPA: DUF3750 domain-containing protein [Geminicoccaceae bacterium]|nr:DUF3750 domain-containing protein [Geminicoccaceae bacterium]